MNAVDPELDAIVAADEAQRRAAITLSVIKLLGGAIAVVMTLAFLDEKNDWRLTLGIQGTAAVLVLAGWQLARRGHARIAAWAVSWMFWAVVCFSTWVFGGLKYEMGTSYIVAVMVAGATLGGRPAVFFAILSIVSSTAVVAADLSGRLPEPIAPSSVINAWISVTVSLLIGSYLLHLSLRSLHEAIVLAYRRGRENEEVLQRLFHAEKMEPVGRLAGGIAHDFNNLLSVFSGGVSLLKRGRINDTSRDAILDDLEGATARMAQMTGQLLTFSRTSKASVSNVRVGHTLREIVPILSRLLGDQITVELAIEDPGLTVEADRARLEQVFLNLAVNARDAMPDGGTLRFEVGGDDGEVVLRVSDTGCGMDDETRERIFTPFFTTKPTGTGLGLATVRDVVDLIGGSIDVTSEIGVGTTFVITLPRSEGPSSPSVHPGPAAVTSGGGRVLLVEDHTMVRRTHQRGLEVAGYDVTSVHDGREALALVDAGARFEVIVSDVMMPRMTGLELVQQLAARGSRTPMLLVSGHEGALTEEVTDLPVPVRFLAKPFNQDRLIAAVAECVELSAAEAPPVAEQVG